MPLSTRTLRPRSSVSSKRRWSGSETSWEVGPASVCCSLHETDSCGAGADGGLSDKELLSKLSENEALMKEMELSWEEKLKARRCGDMEL